MHSLSPHHRPLCQQNKKKPHPPQIRQTPTPSALQFYIDAASVGLHQSNSGSHSMGGFTVIILASFLLITCHAFYSSQHCVMNSFLCAAVARGRSTMAMMPSRWRSTSHPSQGKFIERWLWLSPMPLESDVKVSKVDWVVPPSIDTQLNA